MQKSSLWNREITAKRRFSPLPLSSSRQTCRSWRRRYLRVITDSRGPTRTTPGQPIQPRTDATDVFWRKYDRIVSNLFLTPSSAVRSLSPFVRTFQRVFEIIDNLSIKFVLDIVFSTVQQLVQGIRLKRRLSAGSAREWSLAICSKNCRSDSRFFRLSRRHN